MITAEELIRRFGLQPHPGEGGYYRETWRSPIAVPGANLRLTTDRVPATYDGPRSVGTAIYYLLTPDTVSVMHRLPGVEVFHFYVGDPVQMLLLGPGSEARCVRLGTPEAFRGVGEAAGDVAAAGEVDRVAPGAATGTDASTGPAAEDDVVPQLIVPANTWMGARLEPGGRFALMGTTMAPGFEFQDWQPGHREELQAAYPLHRDLIRVLTPDPG